MQQNAYKRPDWEGFGSDPVLQAFGGALSIEGIQSTGVIATIKHLIANEQEQYRMYSLVKPGISSNVDDRTLHELYLWPFAEGKPVTLHSSAPLLTAIPRCTLWGWISHDILQRGQWFSLLPEQLSDQRDPEG
jgi:beta-glucosidase-like glycosyl hydrolase